MSKRLPLPPLPILLYVLAVALAYLSLQVLLYTTNTQPFPKLVDVIFWIGLVIWSSRGIVILPMSAGISHAFVINIAMGVLFPPWLVMALVAVFHLNKDLGKPTYPWYKDLFNRTQISLAAGLSALTLQGIINIAPLGSAYTPLVEFIGVAVACAVYFIVNVGLTTFVISLATKMPVRKIWFENYRWMVGSYLVLAPVALIMAKVYQSDLLGWGGVVVAFLLVILYYARSFWDERVQLEAAFDSAIEVLMSALDAKDPYTRLHSERVAAIAKDLAVGLGLDESDQKKIRYGARIHDIGKVGIPDSVLFKAGQLSLDEFALIRSHPERGVKLMEPLKKYSKDVIPLILYHHERWDGRGYPARLAGEKIPLWARIVHLADSYEVMTAGRPYSAAKAPSRAMAELLDLSGDQFDPKLVNIFQSLWQKDPIWKDREVFISAYTSQAPSSELPLPSSLAPAYETSEKLN